MNQKMSEFERDVAQSSRSRVEMSTGQRISPNDRKLSEILGFKDSGFRYRAELGPYAETPLLHGFNAWACVVVVANGSCGLAVSFLLRYADSIAKTYATALSIPATHVASHVAFGTPLGAPNVLGTGVMVISLAYYYAGPDLFAPPHRADADARKH